MNRPLVSVDWLSEHLHEKNVRIVDASWHMPATERDAHDEYRNQHIPGACFFDIDKLSAPSTLPHMMPAAHAFANDASKLGLSTDDHIVVYDTHGLFSAARVWWMLRFFGARQVRILDGGLPAWIRAGLPMESGEVTAQVGHFEACEGHGRVAGAADVLRLSEQLAQNGNASNAMILDARGAARFTGDEQEARPGLRSGHIPASKSLPFTQLLDQGYLKSDEQLRSLFESCQVKSDSYIVTTCGSGVTAAIIVLALHCVGVHNVSLYDGSWTEWGGLEDMPVATGV